MNEEQLQSAYDQASKYFQQGYNCAQSVLKASAETLELTIPADIIKAAAGFSGGVGFSGCICGALAGAVMLLGLGRASGEAKKNGGVVRESSLFYRWFETEFASPCCRAIRQDRPFAHKEVRNRCTEVTALTARKVVEILGER